MNVNKNRRLFLQKLGIMSVATGTGAFLPVHSFSHSPEFHLEGERENLTSLPPSEIFSVLDLGLPQLAKVRKALEGQGHEAALSALLEYYRERYPKPPS